MQKNKFTNVTRKNSVIPFYEGMTPWKSEKKIDQEHINGLPVSATIV